MIQLTDEYFMHEALKEADKASEEGEVPVGAIVVSEQHIIARAHNQVEKLSDAIELLEPPKDDDQQDQQQQNQNQDNSGDSEERRNEQNAASQSMNQLLQGVRDREAQRRQKQARTQAGMLTVEKDW